MPAKKSVNSPIAAGRCRVHSAAGCNSRAAIPSALARSAPSAASSAETRWRNASRECGAERHQRVQGRTRGGFGRLCRLAGKQPRFQRRAEIEDHVADRDPAARRTAPRRAEHPERQVLDRKFAVAVGRGDPALPLWIMGFVDPAHRPSPRIRALTAPIILQFGGPRRAANGRSAAGRPRPVGAARARCAAADALHAPVAAASVAAGRPHPMRLPAWRGGRAVEGARLESV